MLYSLARWRHLKPKPPFKLGGELLILVDQFFLRDSAGALRLNGLPAQAFAAFASGDLIIVSILKTDESCAQIEELTLVHKSSRERPRPTPMASAFTGFLHRIRQFFLDCGLQEVITPTLVLCPGSEPVLEPLKTDIVYGSQRCSVHLPTSPEIHLKKILAQSGHDLFEIKNCFRQGELTDHHDIEFLMLEWYRPFADLEHLIEDTQGLLTSLHRSGWLKQPARLTITNFAELFKTVFGFALRPETTRSELLVLVQQQQLDHAPADTFDDLFHRLMFHKIEAHLKTMGPVIVRDFPPSQAALAQINAKGWADRFEFYWNGFEIANAFNEVTAAQEQTLRWERDLKERERLGTSSIPTDPDLIKALEMGMPPTAGIALGIERLFMAAHDVQNIRELKHFSARDLLS